jgi:hypothetical protein
VRSSSLSFTFYFLPFTFYLLLFTFYFLLSINDFEVVVGEAVEVGNPVIYLSFPLGDALAFGIEALLDEGG